MKIKKSGLRAYKNGEKWEQIRVDNEPFHRYRNDAGEILTQKQFNEL